MKKLSSRLMIRLTGIFLLILFACTYGWNLSASLQNFMREAPVGQRAGNIEESEERGIPRIIHAGFSHEVLSASQSKHTDNPPVSLITLPFLQRMVPSASSLKAGSVFEEKENPCTALQKSAGNYAVELVPRSFVMD